MSHKRWCAARKTIDGQPTIETANCNCGVSGPRASLLHRILCWFWRD